MKTSEALYFRLGVISALRKNPKEPATGWESKLMTVLGSDYPMVKEYIEARYDA